MSEYRSQAASQRSNPDRRKKVKKQVPQQNVDEFWEKFTTKFPGKIHSILPKNVYAVTKALNSPQGVVHGISAGKSYEQAAAECHAAVEKIATECRRVNMKYRDPHFDIEFDLKWSKRDCLDGLAGSGDNLAPKSVKRVSFIFEKPQFYHEGITASDVRQGNDGDCWFMAALCALSNKKDLIDRVCVARDEKVGVYGFVFHRDGEWIQTIIDDKLYLSSSDYDESKDEKRSWEQVSRQDAEEEYRKAYQTGSRALYFAQCSNENETWLPLLEKAFAKAHGDYNAIQGGFTGEAIEDLTGGVTTELYTTDILDADKFWTEEILKVNEEFLFGCATGTFDDWQGAGDWTDRNGIFPMHAYSIMEAREVKGKRLLLVRNPWGRTEWQGAWSDGSAEWTPEWMEALNHRFGNDGIFWISYDDLLRKYQSFDRTRLFGPEWNITQQWTTLDVPWSADYHNTKFSVTLTQESPVVIMLSQLDDRYYRGLEGQYDFSLHFRLEKDGEEDYIVRSHGNYLMNRSVSTDLDLKAGTYSVLMKVTATRMSTKPTPEQIIRNSCRDRQEKLIQIGLAYDLAHAKGQFKETELEKQEIKDFEEKKRQAEREELGKQIVEHRRKEWQLNKKRRARDKRLAKKKEERAIRKAEARKTADVPEPVNGSAAEDDVAPDTVESAANGRDQQSGVESEEQATAGAPQPNVAVQEMTEQFSKDIDVVPQIKVNGTSVPEGSTNVEENVAPNATEVDTTASVVAPDESDSESEFDSEFDVDLDLPVSEDEHIPAPSTISRRRSADDSEEESEDEDAEFENDPWNAVCVVGLRVYSKDPGACVTIVRPKREGMEGETPLDLDDKSKGASGHGVVAGVGNDGSAVGSMVT